ncbi:Laminin-like protein epi-1 [Dissostichus eleginoides]|uniref:Laminin-like protein epi-1 n=1 Tax=Dissostichus eleginoides TaxID=100907 RepID=A0AAD9B8W1_DISEL|nr:Laminin-like protein epi-1 [Dissostichus eleginoides]
MAADHRFILIPFLLSCVFPALDNRHGLKEQLSLLNIQLQQTTVRNSQLDNESFGLRREVRALKLQLSTCSSTASAITGSYQTQLLNQLKQLLETSENDTFLILKTIALTREMDTVNEKVQHAANATETADIRVLKIISMLKEVRELETTSTNQATTLQTLLQAKEREFAKAQAEIKELQRKLQLKIEVCSGLEDRYEQVKTEFEQKISELNTAGNHKAALVLNVINLQYELKTLRDLIATSTDPQRVSELQGQLENKQDELNSKTADIERLIANPKIILMIIELQSEIWDLQKVPNETTAGRVDEFQDRVDGLLSVIDDKGDDNTKLMLTIMRLKSRVEQLQRQLSDLQTSQTSQKIQLTKDLTSKQDELQKYINELTEKDETNAKLILKITDLHNQLRNLEKERHNERQNPSVVTALQNESNQTDCSIFVLQLKDLHNKLDGKMKELQSKAESVTSLALQVSTLTVQLEELKRQLQNTESESKRKELQKSIDEKNIELTKKTEELKTMSAQPQRLLQIIAIQTKIEKLVYVAANDTDYNKIRALQDHLNYLVNGIKDEDNEYTKLMFKILTQQNEIARLEKQEKSQREAASERIGSAHILELHKNIKPLEDKISELKVTSSENTRELQKRLDLTRRQLQDSELRLQEADTKNFEMVMEIADLRTQLKKAQKKAVAERNAMELRDKLKAKDEKIRALQNESNQTDCSTYVLQHTALQVSTLTVQLEELKRQLQNTESESKRKELQQIIDEKNTELTEKTEELLKVTSAEPQRLLHIIAIQTEIEKLVYVAANDTDYNKIRELQDRLNDLVDGIKDGDNEYTKLMFKILTQQNEIARLENQEKSQREAASERIGYLENQLEDIRNQIAEKTLLLGSSDKRTANLTAHILELHKNIKPLEDKISELKVSSSENTRELQKRLDLTRRQLQDSELRLQEADTKNFELVMEIADLRTQLKKAQKKAVAERNAMELRDKLKAKDEKIRALQNESNQTDCSTYVLQLTDLHNKLDGKMKELQSKAESVTSLGELNNEAILQENSHNIVVL